MFIAHIKMKAMFVDLQKLGGIKLSVRLRYEIRTNSIK